MTSLVAKVMKLGNHQVIPRLTALFLLLVLLINAPTQVYALSEAQKKALDSGIYYFDPEASSGLCSVAVDIDLNGNDNIEKAYNFFIQKGLTPVQSAALIGNFLWESHMDPTITNEIGAHGIAQWLGGRLERLKNFALSSNKPMDELSTQLEFVWDELNGGEKAAFDELKSETNLEEATVSVRVYYERPGANEAHDNDRINHARAVHKKYAGNIGGVVVIPGSEEDGCSVITGPGQDTKYIDGFTVYSQYDPQWINEPYSTSTIGDSGCGPAAMAMIITTLKGQRVTPVQAANYAALKDMYVPGKGSKWTISPVLAQRWGLKSTQIGADEAKITQVLQAGGLVITSGSGPKPFTKNGHFIVIRGVTSDGKWKVGDSGHRDTSDKDWDPQQILSNMNDGSVYAITR